MSIESYPSPNGVLTSLIWRKTAAGGETSLSGYDNASQALSYTPGQEQVYLNGILLVRGADYTATNGTSITNLTALTVDDFVQINCYNNFSLASVPSTSINGEIPVGNIPLSVARVDGQTFTGTTVLPSTTSIGSVSSTEIGYLDGVTSAIQTQINGKQAIVSGVDDTEIGYLNGVTSAIQTQINAKQDSSAAATLTGTQTLTNKTLTSPIFTGTASIQQILEKATVSATQATGTINYELLTNGAVTYYTSDASGNWTLNLRGDSSTTLNSIMSTGQSLTIAFLVTQGTTAYYQSALQVDGSSVTPKWQGGTSPSSGNTSSIDIYSVTVLKTANNTFTALASQTKYA
jgi:hypothetical protein